MNNLIFKKTTAVLAMMISLGTLGFWSQQILVPNLKLTASPQGQVLGRSDSDRADIIISGKENSYLAKEGLITLASTDEPAIYVEGDNLPNNTVQMKLYEADKDDLLEYLRYDEEYKQLENTLNFDKLKEVTATEETIRNNIKNKINLPLAESGIWVIRLLITEGEEIKKETVSFITRSRTGVVVKEAENDLLLWAYDYASRRSVGGADLEIYNLLNEANRVEKSNFNQEGIARASMAKEADIAIIERDGDIALLPINLQHLKGYSYGNAEFVPHQKVLNSFIFLDRPLYKPGDTVYFKIIARSDNDAQYSLPNGIVNTKITKGWGETKEIVIDRNFLFPEEGNVSGEFKLPNNLATGSYRLEVSHPRYTSSYGGEFDSINFKVEYYEKPEFSLNMEVDENIVISGDQIKFKVRGEYFSGQPLKNKTFNYTVYTSNFYESYYYTEKEADYWKEDYQYRSYWGKKIKEGQVILNENGLGEVELKAYIPENKRGSQIFSIVVDSQNDKESASSVVASKNVLVRPGEFGIYLEKYPEVRKEGETFDLNFSLKPYLDEVNISGVKLKLDIKHQKWIEQGKRYEKQQKSLPQKELITNQEGKAVLNFLPEEEGTYEFEIEGFDSKGNLVKQKFSFWVQDKDSFSYYYNPDSEDSVSGLSISTEKEEYLPGETVKLNINSEIANRDILLSLERGYLHRYQIVKMPDKSQTVEIVLQESDIPNLFVRVYSFSDFDLDYGETSFSVSPERKRINVDLIPEKEKYGPGDTASVKIKTTDFLGNPIATETAFWTIDKALFELADRQSLNIFNHFWHERGNDTEMSHSLRNLYVFYNMEEMGGGGGGESRSVFKDIAYWNPTVKTNDNGEAQVTFKLPDNLTTWAMAAISATADTKVGKSIGEIQVTKDVIVRPILPRILRKDDNLIVSALVQNFTDQDYTFRVSLNHDSGQVENQDQELAISSKESVQVYWPIIPEQEKDDSKLTFSAISKEDENVRDVIIQTIPVRPFGFWETWSEAGNKDTIYSLRLNPDSDLAKSQVIFSAAPTLLGSLPSAMKYLVNYPYGCIEQTTSRFVPAVIAKENQKLFLQELEGKNVDEMIKKGVERLKKHQNSDGGWGWWKDESDIFISAYVVEYLARARKSGIEIDNLVWQNAQLFFNREFNSADIRVNKEDRAVVIYALSYLDTGVGKVKIDDLDDLPVDILSYAIMANARNGYSDLAQKTLERLYSLGQEQGVAMFWEEGDHSRFGSRDASTALAIRAVVNAGGDRQVAEKGVRYLIQSRKKYYWSNTFSNAHVIQAVVDFSRDNEETVVQKDYRVFLDNEEVYHGNLVKAQDNNEFNVDPLKVKTEGSELKLVYDGEGQIYTTLIKKEWRTDKNAPQMNKGIKIDRKYVSERGARYSLAVGDVVTINLEVVGSKDSDSGRYAVVEDHLPAGMIPLNPKLKNVTTDNDYSYYGKEFTEDGVIIYDRYLNKYDNYSYKALVVSEGQFSTPPATASLMYDPEVYGRTKSEKIEITGESFVRKEPEEKDRKNLIDYVDRLTFKDISDSNKPYWKVIADRVAKIYTGFYLIQGVLASLIFGWRNILNIYKETRNKRQENKKISKSKFKISNKD